MARTNDRNSLEQSLNGELALAQQRRPDLNPQFSIVTFYNSLPNVHAIIVKRTVDAAGNFAGFSLLADKGERGAAIIGSGFSRPRAESIAWELATYLFTSWDSEDDEEGGQIFYRC